MCQAVYTALTRLQIQSWAKRRRRTEYTSDYGLRNYGSRRVPASQLRQELAKEHVKDLSNQQKAKKKARAIDKVCLLSRSIRNVPDRNLGLLSISTRLICHETRSQILHPTFYTIRRVIVEHEIFPREGTTILRCQFGRFLWACGCSGKSAVHTTTREALEGICGTTATCCFGENKSTPDFG